MTTKLIILLIATSTTLISCKETTKQELDSAYALYEGRNFENALEKYSAVITRNPKMQLAYYERSNCHIAMKNFQKALDDLNEIIFLKTSGNTIVEFKLTTPVVDEESKTQVDYLDVLYRRGQVKFYMDSLESSFNDFQILIERDYEKSNCILWQGTLWYKGGEKGKACEYFEKAKSLSLNEHDVLEAEKMLSTYCTQTNNNR